MSFRWIYQMLNKLWVFFSFLFNKQLKKVISYQPVKYDLYPLSPGECDRMHFSCMLSSSCKRRVVAELRKQKKIIHFHLSLDSLPTVSRHRLSLVQRKTLVLDLDETLIHSHHDGLPRNPSIKPGTPHDFTVSPWEKKKISPTSLSLSHIFIHSSLSSLWTEFLSEKKKYRAMFTVCTMLWLREEEERQMNDDWETARRRRERPLSPPRQLLANTFPT